MEYSRKDLMPHPQYLELLFAFRNKVLNVFRDVLGIHEIHHIALTRISLTNQIVTFSSTPAMEFNLFSSPLWLYDKSYNPSWIELCTQEYWHHLYDPKRYDELYYLKQIKHTFPIGLSLAAKIDDHYVIYSLASRNSCVSTLELFSNKQEDFYKIGQYCSNMLNPLFYHCESLACQSATEQGDYETSK